MAKDPNDYTKLSDIPRNQRLVIGFTRVELMMAGLARSPEQTSDGRVCLTYTDGTQDVATLDRPINLMECFEIVSAVQAKRTAAA
jgi:hypothetical protein